MCFCFQAEDGILVLVRSRGLGDVYKRPVYAIAVLAILHFFWMRSGKQDFAEVFVYAAILGVLLGWRVWHAAHSRRQARL